MSVTDDYQTIHGGAALGAIAARRQIAVSGADRASYLHGLLTNDVLSLAPGSGLYAAWLTPNGRMLTDMHLLETGEMMLMDVPAQEADAVLARLDQYLFSEEVRLQALDDRMSAVWLHGPDAASVLQRTIRGADGLAGWPPYRVAAATFGEAAGVIVRIDQLGVPGYCLYVEPSAAERSKDALLTKGARTVSTEALEAARIVAGYPVFGMDMTSDTIPLEAGIEHRAISFTKGCYVGQEVIIRVLHRGHGRVAKRLVRVRGEGAAPVRRAKVLSGDRDVGLVTSAAAHPEGGWVALAYVHRDFVADATAVDVEFEGGIRPARVLGLAASDTRPEAAATADRPAGADSRSARE